MYYLLRQPVVSVIESSGRKWDETDVRFLMHRFRAPYFVVFPGARPLLVPEQDATPFLHALTAGEAPGWLRIAARTPGVILYECGECVMATASK
jgi:hypothetical protein